ncbi:MAG: hypothetical protein J0I84_14195 [Terrimonas sp.]|uniref:hypothetical protein n=1 Tax=Terrimonas sp. TaxID=1914338 RepID=UPI000AC28612|nr:hypothetical protein [Terrimonas sp.]MBN8788238.1 hypothetical protein [Terrimonas sp.]
MKRFSTLPGLSRRIMAIVLLAGIVTVTYSCKKDKAPTGSFMFYTFLDSDAYDAIKIYVDGKESGTITLSHIERPDCGTPTSINVVNVQLPAGKHSWSAKQIKNGQEIDEWDERDDTIKEGDCTFIKLTD